MAKIIVNPREILCFPRQGLGWEALDQWLGMAFHKTQNGSTVSGRLPRAPSQTVLREMGELKNWMLEQPVKTKGCSSIQFLLKEFF